MAVTVDDLAEHLGYASTPADTEMLSRALGTATAIIAPHLLEPDPAAWTSAQVQAADLATLTVAGDLWRRKDAPGGSYTFADASEFPATLPRDPLVSVWAWLVAADLVAPAAVA